MDFLMFNTISQKSIAGKRVNEDKIHVGENYIIFLDGASGLRKQLIPNSKSDAKWYVDEFTKTIFIGKWVSDICGKGLCSWRW